MNRSASGKSTGGPMSGHLDSVDFSPAHYVDRLFPDEGSLEGVDVALENLRRRMQTTNQDIRQILRAQSNGSAAQTQNLEETKAAIKDLYDRISEMKAKARTSERMVFDITQDIKSLDFAKRNLTQTMTTMKRLQMLIGAIEQLKILTEQSKYLEAAQVLQAVAGLRESFSEYSKIRQISTLDETAATLQRTLSSQVFREVERGFDAQGLLVGDTQVMHDACLCADALGDKASVVDFYCDLQLRAYSAIFQLNDDVSQLENISRRYAWLRRILRNYSDEHAGVFPESWQASEELSRRFSVATRDHLSEIMATKGDITVEHLMAALSDTLAFETQCNKKFGIIQRPGSANTQQESPEFVYEGTGRAAVSFTGTVSCAFEPYMSIFIRGEQTRFAAMIERFQKEPISIDDDPSLSVLASSTDILYQYRESLRQCASMSTGQAMVDLSQVFSQYLCSYARDVLVHKLPRITASTSTATILDDLKHVCLIVNTADYCASVASQLEQKIVEKVDPEFKTKVSFAACREALLGSINTSIKVLVSGVEAMCEPAFTALSQVPWQSLQMVGDQSGYVLLVSSALEASAQSIRKGMSGTRYFRSYCDKFATRFAERYMSAINKCGQISEVGAEQLLLDAQALKSTLLEMPSMGDSVKSPPPVAYTKIVSTGVGSIEAVLKAILAASDPPDALVDRFILLFPKTPREVFQQVLNLKGIKPADQPTYFRVLQ
ncbi:hypothetical protein GQ54DRAFT_253300, partial [Martensiomyces pterosporus]